MGLDDDGDPSAGHTEEAEDNGDVDMDIEETTDEFLENLEKNSGSISLQKEAARSARTSDTMTATATGTTTGIVEEGMER
jgi:L-2-hydroxyglutarate oxidase LhgO